MNESRQSLSSSEKYVICLMCIIAGLYLILQTISFVSSKSKLLYSTDGSIIMNRNELFSLSRVITTIVLNFIGVVLFIKRKPLGWAINFALLSLLTLLIISILYSNYNSPDVTMVIGLFGVLTLIMGIVFLLFPTTRRKFRVNGTWISLSIALLLLLLLFYLFLQ